MTKKRFIACVCIAGIILCSLVYTIKYGGKISYVDLDDVRAEISLKQNATTFVGNGVSVDGNTVKITSSGTYTISGTLTDGQVYVDVGNSNMVTLILDEAYISNSSSSAIYVANDRMVYLYLKDGTTNVLSSGSEKTFSNNNIDDNVEGGVITFKDDATICGEGSLTINGYLNNGIHCSNNLVIESGVIDVSSQNKGIKGKESIVINGGTITINDSYEGIEGNQVIINDGIVNLLSRDDGINANNVDTTEIPNIIFNGGTVSINASGDGLDSNGNIIFNDGLIIVEGPKDNGNGALDCGTENGGKIVSNGGTLFAIGSSGMAEYPDNSSNQPSLVVFSNYSSGDKIAVTYNNEELISYTATKTGSSIVFSSTKLSVGKTYNVKIGSTSLEIELTDKVTIYGEKSNQQFGRNDRGNMPSNIPNNTPSDMPSGFQGDMPGNMPSDMPNGFPGDMPSDMPDDMPNGFPGNMPGGGMRGRGEFERGNFQQSTQSGFNSDNNYVTI